MADADDTEPMQPSAQPELTLCGYWSYALKDAVDASMLTTTSHPLEPPRGLWEPGEAGGNDGGGGGAEATSAEMLNRLSKFAKNATT